MNHPPLPHTTTALIAEDEPLLAHSLAEELATLWPALRVVAQVGDGTSALTQALALKPAVCLLDIRMPGLTGLACAQALAEEWPAESAPFPLLVFARRTTSTRCRPSTRRRWTTSSSRWTGRAWRRR